MTTIQQARPAIRPAPDIGAAEPETAAGPIHTWIEGLSDAERALYVGLALLSAGLFIVWPPLGLIAPGTVITALAVIFLLRPQVLSEDDEEPEA
jgi:hypothetical protein